MTVEYSILNAGRNTNRPLRIKEERSSGNEQITLLEYSQEDIEKLQEYEENKETQICVRFHKPKENFHYL
jgi:hypothetical protein